MGYVVDADWIFQAARGYQPAVIALIRLAPQRISISWITVAEVYEGAYNSPNPSAKIDAFRKFLAPFEKIGLNEEIVMRFAELRAYLRRRGELIPDFDLMLAATALHYDLTVLTFNVRHLGRVPDLRVYQAG